MTALVFLMAGSLLALPHVSTVTGFGVLYALLLIGLGGYVTAQAAWVIDIWKDKAGPYIQGQHFFYAVGCFIPPALYAPFLKNADNFQTEVLFSNGTSPADEYNITGLVNNSTIVNRETLQAEAAAKITIPTTVCGIIIAVGAFLLLITLVAFRKSKQWDMTEDNSSDKSVVTVSEKSENKEDGNSVVQSGNNKLKKILVIGFAALFVGAFESVEVVTNQYLVVYAKYSGFNVQQADGAKILSACSIAFTLTRLAGVFLIMKVDSRWILFANGVLVSAADILLLIVGSSASPNVDYLWAGSALLGVGFATSIPTIFVYLQKYIEITDLVASILMVGGACIAASYPAIVGAFIETVPNTVLYLSLGTALAATASFLVIMLLVRGQRGRL